MYRVLYHPGLFLNERGVFKTRMALLTHTPNIPEASTAPVSFIIKDEYGVPLAVALTTLVLTYYDKQTETIINAREDQNVLNLANVAYGSTALATVSSTFIASSKTIRRLTGNWLYTDVEVGSIITVAGTASNNGSYTVTRVTSTDLTVEEAVVGEVGISTTFTFAGKVVWTMQPLDTVIVDARKELEEHIALFVWTWATGAKSGSQEILITIENLTLNP